MSEPLAVAKSEERLILRHCDKQAYSIDAESDCVNFRITGASILFKITPQVTPFRPLYHHIIFLLLFIFVFTFIFIIILAFIFALILILTSAVMTIVSSIEF